MTELAIELIPDAKKTALVVIDLQNALMGLSAAPHAVAEVVKRAPKMKPSEIVIVNVSGRGDKDVGILRENLKLDW